MKQENENLVNEKIKLKEEITKSEDSNEKEIAECKRQLQII